MFILDTVLANWVILRGVTSYPAKKLIINKLVTNTDFIAEFCWSHVAGMDTTGSSAPVTIHSLLEQLQEALVLEVKYQPNLQLPAITKVSIFKSYLFKKYSVINQE